MSYTLKQVDDAEARIRRECPGAHVSRSNYDWTLSVARSDMSVAIVLFDASVSGPTIESDANAISAAIQWLNEDAPQ